MARLSFFMSAITLNRHGLNSPNKGRDCENGFQKHNMHVCSL